MHKLYINEINIEFDYKMKSNVKGTVEFPCGNLQTVYLPCNRTKKVSVVVCKFMHELVLSLELENQLTLALLYKLFRNSHAYVCMCAYVLHMHGSVFMLLAHMNLLVV